MSSKRSDKNATRGASLSNDASATAVQAPADPLTPHEADRVIRYITDTSARMHLARRPKTGGPPVPMRIQWHARPGATAMKNAQELVCNAPGGGYENALLAIGRWDKAHMEFKDTEAVARGTKIELSGYKAESVRAVCDGLYQSPAYSNNLRTALDELVKQEAAKWAPAEKTPAVETPVDAEEFDATAKDNLLAWISETDIQAFLARMGDCSDSLQFEFNQNDMLVCKDNPAWTALVPMAKRLYPKQTCGSGIQACELMGFTYEAASVISSTCSNTESSPKFNSGLYWRIQDWVKRHSLPGSCLGMLERQTAHRGTPEKLVSSPVAATPPSPPTGKGPIAGNTTLVASTGPGLTGGPASMKPNVPYSGTHPSYSHEPYKGPSTQRPSSPEARKPISKLPKKDTHGSCYKWVKTYLEPMESEQVMSFHGSEETVVQGGTIFRRFELHDGTDLQIPKDCIVIFEQHSSGLTMSDGTKAGYKRELVKYHKFIVFPEPRVLHVSGLPTTILWLAESED